VASSVRNVAYVGLKVILNRFLSEDMKERVHSEGLCEYGRIILKWILRNCIRVDFDSSCFRRALNDILMNYLMNLKFHKIHKPHS